MNSFVRRPGLLIMFLLPVFSLTAQTYSETALMFTRPAFSGSSRMLSMGGAGISLGGDLSAAHLNPGGLAMFNKGEIAFSIGSADNRATSSYLGTSLTDNKPNLSVPFMGVSFHTRKDDEKLISSSFAITYNRLANFNRAVNYQGRNEKNSIIDYFLNDAYDEDGFPFDPRDLFIPTNLAFETYLIDTITVDGAPGYWSALGLLPDPADFRKVNQTERVVTSGALTQWTFSYAVNISDKFFLGASLGLRNVRLDNRKTYTESGFEFKDTDYKPIDQFTLEERLTVNGSGYNIVIGGIIRPVEGLQVGASYESKTGLLVSDVYDATMSTQWNNFDYYLDGSAILKNETARLDEGLLTEYTLSTPSRLSGGLSWFFGKKGFITAEVGSVNYGGAKYKSRTAGVGFESDNSSIRSLYGTGMNYRFGGEYRYDKMRFRAGGFLSTDPFRTAQNGISRDISGLTGGFGYRETNYYVDLAVVLSNGNQSYRPYRIPSADSPLVKSQNQSWLVQVTLGLPLQ